MSGGGSAGVDEAVLLMQRSFALNALRLEAGSGRQGALSRNVMQFARLLRRAGLPVGPAETLAGAKALTAIDIGDKAQVRAALRAAMVHRHEHQEVFDEAFGIFWRDPESAKIAQAMALMSGHVEDPTRKPTPASRRVAEAMVPQAARTPREAPPEKVELDAVLTVSERERLQAMDFEAMSAAEIAQAKAEMKRLAMPLEMLRTRRRRADSHGPRIDLGRTIRASLARRGGAGAGPHPRGGACAAVGRVVRHLRLDGPLRSDPAAFSPCGVERPRPRARVPVRHAADQHHPPAAPPRPGGGLSARRPHRARLVGRHADRRGVEPVQPAMGQAGARPGCGGAADHRRAGPRGGEGAGREHGPAAPLLPQADLAQSAVALAGLRAKVPGHQGDAAAR